MAARPPLRAHRPSRLRAALQALALALAGTSSAQGHRLFEVPDGQVHGPQFSSDGRYVVCEVERQHGFHEMRSVCVTDLSTRFLLPSVQRHPAFAFDPDGWLYIYRSRRIERHPLDGAPAQLVTPPLAGDRKLLNFMLSPDRRSLVYLADADVADQFHLYRMPVDASAAPVRLDGGLTLENYSSGTAFVAFRSDGSRLAFWALRASGELDLYSAPSDGSAPPILLHGAATGTGSVERYSLQATALGRVVYLARRSGTGALSLYSVPIDGSAAPTDLSPPAAFPAGVPVASSLSPDGRWVVFQADSPTYSLYSVPADGSAGPVRLDGPNPLTRIENLRISADSQRVVFSTAGSFASTLHVVPIDGLAPAVPLTPVGARVRPDFFLSQDLPQRVVYIADIDRRETFELFSQPLDGSAGALALNPSLLSFVFRDVEQLFPSSDGKGVFYEANQDQLFLRELYLSPTDGSKAPRLVSRPLTGSPGTTGISVSAAALSGDRVVYVSNHDDLDSRELFLSWLLPPRRER